jgi:hypothetical protein
MLLHSKAAAMTSAMTERLPRWGEVMEATRQILLDLQSLHRRGYGPDLPGEADASYIVLARAYTCAESHQREQLRAVVRTEGRLLLLGFSVRMAILARRNADPALLELALAAHSLEDFRHDERENISRLALVAHAAKAMGVNPSGLFQQAASLSSPRAAAALLAFDGRPEALKSLKSMRIVEFQTPAGVDYRYG